MNIKKNDEFTLKIEDMSEDGAGIGKTDGFTWFVKDALMGDVIIAAAMKMKKHYGFARLVRVIEKGKGRVEAKCSVARSCGGCQLQELSYEEQLEFKQRKIYNNLKRIGGLSHLYLPNEEKEAQADAEAIVMEPIIGMEHPWRYRNKAQYPIGRRKDGTIAAGFYAGRTHSLIPIPENDCLLGCEENKKFLDLILQYMNQYHVAPYDEKTHTGLLRHVLIRKGFASGEMMVCIVINGEKLPHEKELIETMKNAAVTSLSVSVNQEKTNVIMGTQIRFLYGREYITDKIGNIEYRISPLSFYQVNPIQTEKLYGTALEFAGLSGGETVWDLYCGIGTISSFLAQKAKQVYGVEIIPEAIADARENAKRNGIKNVEFFVGKAEEVLPEQYEKNHIYADVIVVDPPRKGCDSVCLDTIVKMQPQKVVYVSCDSSTLARDVKYLGERGYRVERVRGVDMFGMSGHVETCVLLGRKIIEDKNVEYEHVDYEPEDAEYMRGAKGSATYAEIKKWIKEQYNVSVSSLYIAQVKDECGFEKRDNYNKGAEGHRVPQCPEEKRKVILEAFKHFRMI